MKPFLRWAGSKRKLLPQLRVYCPHRFERYVEPFMGSACLFFEIEPAAALLGDTNPELVQTFRAIQADADAVFDELARLIPRSKPVYYTLRSADPTGLDPAARAARFLYLNRYCFNGLYRTNRSGAFNVPFSNSRTGELPTLSELQDVSSVLQNAQIKCADFQETLSLVRAGDFVYMDPPHAATGKRVFNQYGPEPFGLEDLSRLAVELDRLNSMGVAFLVSYAKCDNVIHILSKWFREELDTNRNIAGFAKHRRLDRECVFSNTDVI